MQQACHRRSLAFLLNRATKAVIRDSLWNSGAASWSELGGHTAPQGVLRWAPRWLLSHSDHFEFLEPLNELDNVPASTVLSNVEPLAGRLYQRLQRG